MVKRKSNFAKAVDAVTSAAQEYVTKPISKALGNSPPQSKSAKKASHRAAAKASMRKGGAGRGR